MKALLVALLLVFASPLLGATASTKFTVSNTAWTDLGPGPLQVGFRGQAVYAIGDVTPAVPIGEGFVMIAGDSVRVATPSHVWAAAVGNANADVYVAPIN